MRQPLKVRAVLLLIRALGVLPLRVNHAIGALIGHALASIPSKTRRTVRVNLQLCLPDLSADERERLLRRSLVETCKTATEVAYFWTRPPERLERLIKEVRGLDVFNALMAQGKGLIVAVPHLGAWELMGLYWARHVRLHSLYRPPRHPEYEALLTLSRQRSGAVLLPTTANGIRRLYQALEQKHVAAILPDQEPPGQGVYAPFFGHPAKTMTLLNKLARRTGAPVLFAFGERLPKGQGYRIHLRPAPEGIDDPDPEVAAAALNRGVEECARLALPQYQWTYRRFRRQPDGSDPYAGQPK